MQRGESRYTTMSERRGKHMSETRSCGWLAGPKDSSVRVSSAKWWLAVSRDVMATEYRKMMCKDRPPTGCHRVPRFVSPLKTS